MKTIVVPEHFNYIGAFLTFDCQYKCPYCINHHGRLLKGRHMESEDWVKGLNRIQTSNGLPITIQGGEPTIHPGFSTIVQRARVANYLDLMTNLAISAYDFMDMVGYYIFDRMAKYACIRVSYHHGQADFMELMEKVKRLLNWGYNIGVWEIAHPDYYDQVLKRKQIAEEVGIDYRLKDLIGIVKGQSYGNMRYIGAIDNSNYSSCKCKTNELLIDPCGDVYRCHADLYSGRNPIGNIVTSDNIELGEWRECKHFGGCNACDIKIKTNRFQQHGHSSVEIKDITPTSSGSEGK